MFADKMLTYKTTKIHGMKDDRWTTRDKSLQYRGILKLHAREKKLGAQSAAITKDKIARNLRKLKSDVKEYRKIVGEVECGDKRRFRSVVQGEKQFRVQLQDAEPPDVFATIFQDYDLRRKQLDKALHAKRKRIAEYFRIKSEIATLNDDIAQDRLESGKPNHEQQNLILRCKEAVAKEHAAKSYRSTYQAFLGILKKDSVYFDGVIRALKRDQEDQTRVVYKATMMGQLASEAVDDLRQKYKKISHEIWINMKERERDLEITRKRTTDLWEYAKSLVRVDSDTNLAKRIKSQKEAKENQLEKQIMELEKTFNVIKESMLIRSFDEFFDRIDNQIKQRERLSALFERSSRERDELLEKKSHAELILSDLEHGALSTTTEYRTKKKEIQEAIERQRHRETECKGASESRGKLILKMKTALQNMAMMMMCINAKQKTETKTPAGKKAGNKETEDSRHVEQCQIVEENDSIAILNIVLKKATNLASQASIELDQESKAAAKDMYQNHVAETRAKTLFSDESAEQMGMMFEHEAIDMRIPTRKDIKLRSRQIVELNTKEDD